MSESKREQLSTLKDEALKKEAAPKDATAIRNHVSSLLQA